MKKALSAAVAAFLLLAPAAGFAAGLQTGPAEAQADIVAASPGAFAYAHGTASAHDKMFIGLANVQNNPFPTNIITIFSDPRDLKNYQQIGVQGRGDIQTMVYDQTTDKVYFELSSNGGLYLYSLDPVTYAVRSIVATTSVDAGRKPAITTDGTYIYGITNGSPSTVFKARISDGRLWASTKDHISGGHSAAIGIFGSTTELYFGGGMSGAFEKDNAATLAPIAKASIAPCALTDDMPFAPADSTSGYVYLGCENQPDGYRVRTSTMKIRHFNLPENSFGLFIFGNDLFNAGFDGTIDIFPGKDISDLHRYRLSNWQAYMQNHGLTPYVNEIFFSPTTQNLYITAWWGVRGLFRVATST